MVRSSLFAAAALAVSVSAIPMESKRNVMFKISTAPGSLQEVTESQKFELKAEGVKFFDFTDEGLLPENTNVAAVTFPIEVQQQTAVNALLPSLNETNLKTTLTTFTSFHNRYYKSTYGQQSSAWLLKQVQAIIDAAKPSANIMAMPFAHSWGQPSVIATIPGTTANIVVLGAHQDSINARSPQTGVAPGADDDGSASMELLETFRVLLTDKQILAGENVNTIEFHWYAAEEGGLLGSKAVFNSYKADGKVVKAMLNQDMAGYVKPGTTESIGLFTDYVDAALTTFVGKVIGAYSKLPAVETKCGYACSDHASARNAGYPSALISEAAFEDTSQLLHTAQDTLDTITFSHVIEMAKVALGFAYELGFALL
ncbi:hypothetical protein G7054_g11266 [Neopestalotiopsis clavispora]|nr:hypothetical protein G7054_g11266 [Neopestalotiopsis clavispora]